MYDLIVGGIIIIAIGTGIVSWFGWITLIVIIAIIFVALFMLGSKNIEVQEAGFNILSSPFRLLGAFIGGIFGFLIGFILSLIIQFLFGVNETTNILTSIIMIIAVIKGVYEGFINIFD